ncbi:MAG TPA: hypothetical protein DCO86_02530 [Spirochaetaceae bacterium]|nr:hypothetical protein [Spirochaetaceae bacterium]
MRNLILGGYSCISDIKDASRLTAFADNCLAPLLQYLYKNAHFEFTLYISGEEMDWIDANRPAMQKLISRLIKRKSVSLLISSRNHSFMPISTSQDIADQVERMRVQTRKYYKSKCRGFFAFAGFWSPELIAKLIKSDVAYSVVPTFVKDGFPAGPFFMSEHGKRFVIYPSDFYLADKVREYCENLSDFDRLKSDTERFAARSDKDKNVSFFLDFDSIMSAGKSPFFIIDMIFNAFRDSGFRFSNTDDDISFKKMDYLCSGSYLFGNDFLGRLFKTDDTFDKIAMISYASSLCADKMIAKKDRETLKSLSMPLSYGGQFVKGYDAPERYREVVLEFLSGLNSSNIRIPEILELDFMGLMVIRKKGYLAFLDIDQGCVRRVLSAKNAHDICFAAPSFRDVVQDSRKGRSLAKYGSYRLSEVSDGRITLVYQNDSLDYSVKKTFSFSEGNLSCDVTLTNIAMRSISFSFAQFFYFGNGFDVKAEGKQSGDFALPLSSAQPSGFLDSDSFSKTRQNDCLSALDPSGMYMPYYDVSLSSDEVVDFRYSVNVPRFFAKEKKTAEAIANEN